MIDPGVLTGPVPTGTLTSFPRENRPRAEPEPEVEVSSEEATISYPYLVFPRADGGDETTSSSSSSKSAASSTADTKSADTSDTTLSTRTTSSSKSGTPIVTSFPFMPLTTQFSRPATCSGVYSDSIYMIDPMTQCMPESFSAVPTRFYSPGLICPVGYTTACQDSNGVASITTAICCPGEDIGIQMSCPTVPWQSRRGWSRFFCTYLGLKTDPPIVNVTKSSYDVTRTVPITFSYPDGLNAYGVRLVYQSEDLTKYSIKTHVPGESSQTSLSDSVSASITASGNGTVSAPTTTAVLSPDQATSSAGVSTSAKVAVGVSVPLAVAFIAGLGWLFYRRRNRDAGSSTVSSPVTDTGPTGGSSGQVSFNQADLTSQQTMQNAMTQQNAYGYGVGGTYVGMGPESPSQPPSEARSSANQTSVHEIGQRPLFYDRPVQRDPVELAANE